MPDKIKLNGNIVTPDDLSNLKDIKRLFGEILVVYNRLSPGAQQVLFDLHNEHTWVGHCVRWGEQNSQDAIESIEAAAAKMNYRYIINAEGQVEEINYNELVLQFVDMTTTPRGIAPRFHVREEIWFKVGDDLFEKEADTEDAANSAEEETGVRPAIKEVTRFEGWTWGHQGNFPKQIQVFDTREEADEWLFKGAEIDFQNDCNAPMTFDTKEEAEEWLKENITDDATHEKMKP